MVQDQAIQKQYNEPNPLPSGLSSTREQLGSLPSYDGATVPSSSHSRPIQNVRFDCLEKPPLAQPSSRENPTHNLRFDSRDTPPLSQSSAREQFNSMPTQAPMNMDIMSAVETRVRQMLESMLPGRNQMNASPNTQPHQQAEVSQPATHRPNALRQPKSMSIPNPQFEASLKTDFKLKRNRAFEGILAS